MKRIDKYSYHCGVIDAFNEMVANGVKKFALSHPQDSKEKRDEYISISEEICLQYQTHYYLEDEPFVTDLFPISMCKDKYLIVYYKDKEILDMYLNLKKRKQEAVKSQMYDDLRFEIAATYGKLLSYTDEEIERLITNNDEKE